MAGSKDRLNLLFHTKVLGRSDQEALIRDYCSSLDAAWEGLTATDAEVIFQRNAAGTRWMCGLATSYDVFHADHPAEALVLACLRAVGVSEEELK